MISVGTYLTIADNSGAKVAQCIRVVSKKQDHYGTVGDTLVLTVKEAIPRQRSKVTAGKVYRGIIVETKKEFRRHDGSFFHFERNIIALLNTNGHPIATRVSGFGPYELRQKGQMKLVAMSSSAV